MPDALLSLYHRLPPGAKSAAATLRGYYLKAWRYGSGSNLLIRAAIERERWSPTQWRIWREQRLAEILHRAATKVPYYRDAWARRRRAGDRSSWEMLENWPVLEKDVLRENPSAFLADGCNPRHMLRDQTSGTTGKPLHIWRSRSTVESLYALVDARTDRWHEIPRGARWARLGGQLVVPTRQRTGPFWVWNAAMRQLYMSTHHLAPDLIPQYLDALVKYRIVYLAGYSSALVALAQEVVRLGRKDLPMLAAFTNAEPLRPDQRAIIAEAFHCPVVETYGMTEMVAAGSECPAGRLHEWPEVGYIEVREDGRMLAPGEAGDFLCTGLMNPDMPLIRYRVGDRGRLAAEDERCACGRTLPVIAEIQGRTTDLLLTRDGRQVFWLNPVFYGLPIRQSQIVQDSLDQLTVRVAPAPGFGPATGRTIVERLRSRMGDLQVALQVVDEVPRTKNGKLQAVVCNLAPEEREAALHRARQTPSAAGV